MYPLYTHVQIKQLMYLHKLLTTTGRPSEALHTEYLNSVTHPSPKNPDHPKSWFDKVTNMLRKLRLPTDLNTIEHTPKARWKSMTEKAAKDQFNVDFYKAATTSTKMTEILTTKQIPTLEKYVTALSRKKASAVFRLRSKTTRAPANQCTSTRLPICTRCNDGLASDNHYFSECTATKAEHDTDEIQNIYLFYT